MERLLGAPAVRGRVGQRADRVEQLDHRARPAVGHDQRQRVLVRRGDVDEVDLHAVDLGDELRQLVQPRLDAPEVVLVQPVAGKRLRRGELHTLRPVVDQLLARPARRGDTPTQIADEGLGTDFLPASLAPDQLVRSLSQRPRGQAVDTQGEGYLAERNVLDPFNAVTILGSSAIAVVGTPIPLDGPGMRGFGRSVASVMPRT